MADAGVIKELFVSLGIKVDQSAFSRLKDGVKGATKSATELQEASDKAAKAVTGQGEALKKAADEPTRKYVDAHEKISKGQASFLKQTTDIARVGIAAAGAFATGIVKMASSYEQLYYMAMRAGTTADSISKLQFASEQVGQGAQGLANAVVSVNHAISAGGPGIEGLVKKWSGADWEKAKDKTKPMLDLMQNLVDKFNEGGTNSKAFAEILAQQMGIPVQLLRDMAADGGKLLKETKANVAEMDRLIAESGVNQAGLAEKSHKIMGQLGEAQTQLGLVWSLALGKISDPLIKLLGYLNQFLDWVLAFNDANPGAALGEVAAASAAAGVAFNALLSALGVGGAIAFGPMTAAALALAAAGLLIVQNWEPISKFFKNQFDVISDDFNRHDWKSLGSDLGLAIKYGFTSLGNWLIGEFEDMGRQVAHIDWNALGKTVGTAVADGFGAFFGTNLDGQNLGDRLVKAFGDLAKIGFQAGEAFMAGLSDALEKQIPGLKAVEDLLNRAMNFAQGGKGVNVRPDPGAGGGPVAPGTAGPGAAAPKGGGGKDRSWGEFFQELWSGDVLGLGMTPAGNADAGNADAGNADAGNADAGSKKSFQGGGIVTADLHEGEMVLPPPISRGLQALIKAGTSVGSAVAGAASHVSEDLQSWLKGSSGAKPQVVISNFEEFISGLSDEANKKLEQVRTGGTGGGGEGGGGGGGGAAGGGGGGSGGPDYDTSKGPAPAKGTGGERVKSWLGFLQKDLHLTKEKSAAMVAVLQGESGQGLDPTAVNPTSGAFGTAQWLGTRMTQLKEFARTMHEDYRSTSLQQKFFKHEVEGEESAAWKAILNAKGAVETIRAGVGQFERPGDVEHNTAIRVPNYKGNLEIANQMDATHLGVSARASTGAGVGANVTHEGDKNVSMNITNNINVTGDGGHDTATRYAGAHKRIYGDAIRNMKTSIA